MCKGESTKLSAINGLLANAHTAVGNALVYKQSCNTLHPEINILTWKLISVICLHYYKMICELENKFLNHTSTSIY